MVGQQFSGKTDQTEKWYSTQFSVRNITPETISQWTNVSDSDDQLHLPAVNEFIPTNFDLLTPPEGAPPRPVLVQVLRNNSQVYYVIVCKLLGCRSLLECSVVFRTLR